MTALASQQARRPGLDLPAMLKEAGVTALIALALTFPLVGLRTVDVGSRLTVSPRFTEVAIAVALVDSWADGAVAERPGLWPLAYAPSLAGLGLAARTAAAATC